MSPSAPQQTPGPVGAFIALGSNLGDRKAHLDFAVRELSRLPGTRVVAASDYVETDPVGTVPQGRYLNAAAEVSTTLAPRPLLEALLDIERRGGRDRGSAVRWGPRTLDLDLLMFGDRIINEPSLTVPHPRLHERLFVLVPLAQIAPDRLVHGLGASVAELLARARSADLQQSKGETR